MPYLSYVVWRARDNRRSRGADFAGPSGYGIIGPCRMGKMDGKATMPHGVDLRVERRWIQPLEERDSLARICQGLMLCA
jgi:hypothetical protein